MRRASLGNDTTTLQTIKNILFQHLNSGDVKAVIFGSWAQGNRRTYSDIDVGLESSQPLDAKTLETIRGAFEESDLPYIVDVVDFSGVSDQFRSIAKQKIIKLN